MATFIAVADVHGIWLRLRGVEGYGATLAAAVHLAEARSGGL